MKQRFLSIILVSILILSGVSITGCDREVEPPISQDKAWFGFLFFFDARIIVDGEVVMAPAQGLFLQRVISRVSPNGSYFDPSYTELIFVHSAEEAEGFPDNVIVAWPSEVVPYFLPGLNEAVMKDEADIAEFFNNSSRSSSERDVICLEDFGLSYPLTIEDFVDNWEGIYRLWRILMLGEQGRIEGVVRSEYNRLVREWQAERQAEREREEYDEA